MVSALKPFARLASPRGLLAMSLVLGSLSTVAGRGTFAYLSSNVVSQPSTFSGGVVDIAGLVAGSTASQLTTNIFSWDTNGALGGGSGTLAQCANVNSTAVDITTQRMAPGHFCVAKIDLNNNNTNAVDAWMRLRVVRSTATGVGTVAEQAAVEALNDRLKFYMHEYSGGTAAANLAARDTDCATANYKPTWTGPTAITGTGALYDYNSVPGTSSGKILNTTVSGSVTRTALTTLGDLGKNLGAHPGMSAVKVNDGTNPAPYAAQDAQVLALVNATAETGVASAASTNGLRLKAGTGGVPAEGNMVTTLGATRSAYNLVGNDEVTNPVRTSTSAVNGTEPHGINTEAALAKGATRYYCAAVFFPIDTDQSMSTVYATTATVGTAAGLGMGFPLVSSYAGGQYVNCVPTPGATGCTNLGDVGAAMTAQNGTGDNAAANGNVTYYLTVSAAQQAGRTLS